jgi:hypothetical protein
LSAGGSTSMSVTLLQSDGNLYTTATDVTFSSTCIALGLATVSNPLNVTTGIGTGTYSATGCSGADVITATATVGGKTLTATGTVTVAPATVGSIQFISASPQKIGLQGTGGVGLPETSTVTFKVVDSTGGPVAGADVQFSLDTSVGGISFTPASATTGPDGRAQTVVKSGTVATTVRVSAQVVSTSISTQSSQLTVTTGLPVQNAFSLAVQCPNVEAYDYDGVINPVTVRLGDRYNNPVPDGTAVTFSAEGGHIQGSCTTTTTSTESGVCSVNWSSSNPRPTDGRVTLFATAIGEESFVDVNGNGVFDDPDTFTDLPEAFRDDNENGVYNSGEQFYDFNQNSVRDLGDGLFNGLLCQDTTGRCSAQQKTGISAQGLIIMSGSAMVISDDVGGVLTLPGFVTFTIGDARSQPPPSGTTVAATASSATVEAPTSYTVPCTSFNGPIQYRFYVDKPTAPSGVLTLTVTTPKGLATIYQISTN